MVVIPCELGPQGNSEPLPEEKKGLVTVTEPELSVAVTRGKQLDRFTPPNVLKLLFTSQKYRRVEFLSKSHCVEIVVPVEAQLLEKMGKS